MAQVTPPASSIIHWAARRAPLTISPTRGLSASRHLSLAAFGSAMTRRRRWATRKPGRWPRYLSGLTLCGLRSGDASRRISPHHLQQRILPWRKKRTRQITRRATARHIDAALLPIRSTRVGAAGGVHGFGADCDALCHTWPPDEDSQARRHDYIAGRAYPRGLRAGA